MSAVADVWLSRTRAALHALDYYLPRHPRLGWLRRCAPFVAAAAGVWLFLALHLLTVDVMGERTWNEADVMPLALQSADPNWIPNDWYLNHGAGYRFAFQRLAGPMVREFGFVPAAIIGRAMCYALVAAGLATIAGALRLRPWMLVLAVVALLSLHPTQSMPGGEWFVGGFEAKAIAWGLALLAIGMALSARYPLAMLLAGLAASFHVLVGGWLTVALWTWLLTVGRDGRPLRDRDTLLTLASCALATTFGAAGAILPLWSHLSTAAVQSEPSANFIYVFLRLPHHLSPASWTRGAWMQLALFVALFAAAVVALCKYAKPTSTKADDGAPTTSLGRAELHFAAIVGISLLPFAAGLIASLFDHDGVVLRYYPFRVGGVLLPLGAYLLSALAVQRWAERGGAGRYRGVVAVVLCLLLSVFIAASRSFNENMGAVAQATAPGASNGTDGEAWTAVCDAVRALTPEHATIITPPAGGADFTWRTGRARVANFKLMPQTPAAIVEWYRRMRDLSGGADLAAIARTKVDYDAEDCRAALTSGYKSLTTRQASLLMAKYGCDHFLTTADHRLDLPILYENERYVLYSAPILPVATLDLFRGLQQAHVRSFE